MPIVDVQVFASDFQSVPGLATKLANALGGVFNLPPGRVWVRLSALPSHAYAENQVSLEPAQFPVFVGVLHADLPAPETLAIQATAVTQAVAMCIGCASERVHVEYAPSGRGRVAFGGRLLQ
jgi:phenylpyruvate tautomerase PptA (4-oxalocrotonate tautomerase family)